jgi:hypothetical protein
MDDHGRPLSQFAALVVSDLPLACCLAQGTEGQPRRLSANSPEQENPTVRNLLSIATILVLLSGCAWVQPEPGASRIALIEPSEALECQRLAQTTVSVRDRVAGVQRSPSQIAEELRTLARDSAIDVGGNAILAEEVIEPGKQRFGIYFCGPDREENL